MILVVLAILMKVFLSGIRIVRPVERGLIETLGRYSSFAQPGFNWIVPIFQTMIYVDITEEMIESGEKQMITNDNLNVTIDSVIYFKVKADEESCKKAAYNVDAYEDQIVSLAKTTLRSIIGTMTLKSANSERNKINESLKTMLEKEATTWGLEIVRAELKEIEPPEDVQATMNNIVKAENDKVAAIDYATAQETQADGLKRSKIKEAEGNKQANILRSQGIAESLRIEAEGKALAIKTENEAANTYFVGNAQLLKKIDAAVAALKDNTKFIIPEGQSLINVLGNLTRN